MELLQTFYTAVRFGNFTKAANFLHVSQSTLSRKIDLLEKEFGVKLLERNNREMSLTVAGEALYREGEKLLSHMTELKEQIYSYSTGVSGTLTVGSLNFHYAPLYDTYNAFHQSHPGVLLDIQAVPIEIICENLLKGKLDIGVTYSYAVSNMDEFDSLTLCHDRFYIVASKSHPLVAKARKKHGIAIEDLQNEQVLVLRNMVFVQNFLLYDINNHKRSKELHILFSTTWPQPDTLDSMRLLTKAGVGVSFMPKSVAMVNGHGCALLPIQDLDTSFDIVLLWRKKQTNQTVSLFLEAIRAHLDEVNPGREEYF